MDDMRQPVTDARHDPCGSRTASLLAFRAGVGNLPREMPAQTRKPWWLYPNLLSLDAPLVALAWLYVFARTWRLGYHPWEAYAVLGLAVWVIHVLGRLLDVTLMGEGNPAMEERNLFHSRHRRWFKIALMWVIPVLIGLVVMRMPVAIYKHLIPAGVMVAGFFGLVMISSQEPGQVSHTKNILGGMTFAFGTAIAAHIYRYEFDMNDLILSREFVCFAVLCIMNMSAIGMWEHAARWPDRETAASNDLALTLPLILLGGVSLAYAAMDEQQSNRPFFYAILTGSGLLYVLNRYRALFPPNLLRVLADLTLLAPVLVFIAARR
jgi:hypothetical protein